LKTSFCPDAVDCARFTPELMGSVRTESNLTIGFVGRITESKGVKVLLHAFAALGGHHQLVLVGRGDLEIELKQTAERLGVQGRTMILPPVLHSEMPEVMRSFDILVLPSLETLYWKEQFGRVLIEGMACGIPVIASRSGGIPEVVGDTGILFESGNTTSLKESLASLIASPSKREELGRKGRERVLQNYDVTVAAKALSRDLLSVLSNR
jgi:glycosyltransferase involved in cell wall biosynthesis